ncbi:putative cytosol aminopeptidase [Gregarina niphandrodes]|uniref:Cytosol aminopeptidase n=1 Tax=Gregarina niphandrodes TaxID=110365 RepID=A0A023B3K4_GRENI|nr:putative cytosol aminopeptidase [Gregarina niphandrodes]EZG55579.1 putative cytosol aminopeptidase [Gregarina niphandrodes]|eukprot:XP_011131492.1 putative cytosol aminopeptidase [Gregarina niphandrodes]
MSKLMKLQKFSGKAESYVSSLLLDENVVLAAAGVGEESDSVNEQYYVAGQQAGTKVRSENPDVLVIVYHDVDASNVVYRVTAFLHRFLFSLSDDMKFKSRGEALRLKAISVVMSDSQVREDRVMLSAVCNTARTLASASVLNAVLVDLPPNVLNCQLFARIAEHEAKSRPSVSFEVFDEHACADRKMGAFLAVAQGSRYGARLVHLTYRSGSPKRKVALVGKGITMDTGGYNLKTGDGILWMKGDMGGAALVLSTVLALADLEIQDVEVHAVAAVCENMIDKDAYRPGDIVTASNGKTIEIQNTDAEGRLALCDALVFAEQTIGADVILDAATLTGACLVGLGLEIAAVYSNCDQFREQLCKSATVAGEAAWGMPLRKRYLKTLQPPYCDLSNVKQGFRYGGSITAALFLQEFIQSARWAHLDIAGPAWNFEKHRGAGYGVAMLVDWLANN